LYLLDQEELLATELLPRSVDATEGPAFWFLNNLCIIKATSESTGGAFSLVHQVSPPGHATPYHVHHVEDEAFFVLDGEFTFICDGSKTIVGVRRIYLLAARNTAWNPGERQCSLHDVDSGDPWYRFCGNDARNSCAGG